MPLFGLFRQKFSDREPTFDVDQQERTLAVLTGAQSVIRRGWLQGAWYVLEASDGRRRSLGPASLTPRSYGTVVQACLVGAVVEAARWHSPEPGAAGSAIDALWSALLEAEGRRPDPDRGMPSPAARRVHVRELTRWNDRRDRTQDDVLRLVDVAIGHVVADMSTVLPHDAAGGRPRAFTPPLAGERVDAAH